MPLASTQCLWHHVVHWSANFFHFVRFSANISDFFELKASSSRSFINASLHLTSIAISVYILVSNRKTYSHFATAALRIHEQQTEVSNRTAQGFHTTPSIYFFVCSILTERDIQYLPWEAWLEGIQVSLQFRCHLPRFACVQCDWEYDGMKQTNFQCLVQTGRRSSECRCCFSFLLIHKLGSVPTPSSVEIIFLIISTPSKEAMPLERRGLWCAGESDSE